MDVRVFPIMILVCVSPTISGIEFLLVLMPSIFKCFSHLENHIVVWLLSCSISLAILDIN